jgi:type IV pilus assembly protein PilQ
VALDGKNFRVIFPKATAPVAKVAVPAPAKPEVATVTAPPAAVAAKVEKPVVNNVEKPAAAGAPATLVNSVTVTPGRALLATNGSVGRFEHFTLGNPPRLVVDLFGLKPDFKQRTFAATAGMKMVRVGAYADKVRFVFDAAGSALPEHMVEKQDDGLVVSWASGAQPVATVPTPPPAGTDDDQVAVASAASGKKNVSGRQVSVEALDFLNHDGRSHIVATLSEAANISQPVQDGNLVRFEIKNATISRSLRRTIDASAFPSAVKAVTPYLVTDDGKQTVRIAVELKGQAPFTLVDEGRVVRLVIDDEAYAEATPPLVTTREVVANVPSATDSSNPYANPSGEMVVELDATRAPEGPRYSGQKISLVFDNADIRSILQLIGDVSGMNILASNDVKGEITLRLIDVPWDQALDLVLDTANLGKMQEGNVIRIMPLDKIRERQQASMNDRKTAVEEGVLETRAFSVSYSKVEDVKKYLEDLRSKDRGSIISDPRNKQLIIKDVAPVLDQMAEMIKRVDRPERQVMIEARIVEANTNFSRQLGVKWNFDYQDDDNSTGNGDINSALLGLGGSFLIPVTNPAAAGLGSSIAFGALDGNLNIDLRLSALESSGEGKIISTPRVTTLNGEKAMISQGTKIPYVTTSQDGTNVSFENAELKLDVTPEINPDGSVILDIKASNSAVGTVYQTSNGETPAIDEKKAETKVLVRDGQTTVIGGIFIENDRTSNTGVPWLKDIPFLGHLFKSTSTSKERRELLIFITPRILQS